MPKRFSHAEPLSPGQAVVVFVDELNSGATLGYCGVVKRVLDCGPSQHATSRYQVFLPYFGRDFVVSADELFATDAVDRPVHAIEPICELRFDTTLADDNEEVAGSYRIPPCDWEYFEFRKAIQPVVTYQLSMPAEPHRNSTSSLRYQVPRAFVLDRSYVLKAIGELIGHADWKIR